MKHVIIGEGKLTLDQLNAVVRGGRKIKLSHEAKQKMQVARDMVDACVNQERVVYGLTTGFGKFSDVTIPLADSIALQENLITSHACGVGEPLPVEVVKAMILLRVNALAVGYSGIRIGTVETLAEMLNRDVIPLIPSKGSLGASGDLVPLAHMSLVLLGMGEAIYQQKRMSGAEAMAAAGLTPVRLTSKEGLALINGTPAMCALGALAMIDAKNLVKTAEIVAALSMEAENAVIDAMDPRVHQLRKQPGQIITAENMRTLLAGSQFVSVQGEKRVQDAYAFRCIPQIHGASRDAVDHVSKIIQNELNAVTDNPIIFADTDQAISGGNFHGQYLAIGLDYLGIAISELANVSERRTERLVNPALSGLPAFLVKNGGVNSGMMIAQYTAASLVSENKVLSHPASVDSIPTSGNQEDHVSMGMTSARKAREIIFNTVNVLAIELMCAAQAIEFQGTAGLSPATKAVYDKVREYVDPLDQDRVLYPDIDVCAELIWNGSILQAAEQMIGTIK